MPPTQVERAQAPVLSAATFPHALAEIWIQSGTVRTQTTPVWDAGLQVVA